MLVAINGEELTKAIKKLLKLALVSSGSLRPRADEGTTDGGIVLFLFVVSIIC